MTANRVVYTHPGGSGWSTVELMARLLARLLGADLVELDGRARSYPVRRALAGLPRRHGRGHCIVIAPQPVHLAAVMRTRHVLGGFASASGWVIDSFWDDRIPAIARGRGHFDHLFITDRELVGTWQERTGTPTSWLPFGSDVMAEPSPDGERGIDLLRVGRQPATWEDDEATIAAGARRGLTFAGRPDAAPDAGANQSSLHRAMRDARFTLSFTNLVSPDVYTHPTRDYVTGRWTDALAAGCVVAGARPRCEAAELLFWPGATMEIDPHDLERGSDQLADAVRRWTPETAVLNHTMALERLDWRWRFAELVGALDLTSDVLDGEIEQLENRIRR